MNRRLLHFVSFALIAGFIGCYKPYDIVADVTPPGEVTELTVEKGDVDVTLKWTPPSDKDLIGFYISLYNADNQRLVTSQNRPPDSAFCVFEKLAAGNYYAKVQTRDKENNLSDGVTADFIFLSKAPVNVSGISVRIYWNVMHVAWDSLTEEDYTTVVEGQSISTPVDSIIIDVDSGYRRIALLPNATSVAIPDLPDGYHSVKVFTHGETDYYSAEYKQGLLKVQFADKFVRVQGNGYDFYIARYEVTTDEYKEFVQSNKIGYKYYVDNSKVEDDKWFKWWYGTDPVYTGTIYPVGFATWEFGWDGVTWTSNRYTPEGSFGRVSWEGAMLYSLVKYNGRCPTKDEWLYAAKGGPLSKGYDYAGGNDPDAVGWWGWDGGTSFSHAPGLKVPNELGIYDMSGNAAEILYDLVPASGTLGKTQIAGGSFGPIHFWGNEGEDFGPENTLKPKLSDPQVVKNTGTNSDDAQWRMGIRVLIPHEEIVKPPINIHKYEAQ